MVILNENNLSIKLADNSTIKLNELGYDTQLADSTNGLENKTVTYELLKRKENSNKVVTKNPNDYSDSLTTRASIPNDNYDRTDYDNTPYNPYIRANTVTTSGYLNNNLFNARDNRIYSNDKRTPQNDVFTYRDGTYTSLLKRNFYNTATRKNWNYSNHEINQTVDDDLVLDSDETVHAILTINSTIRIASGEAMQFTLSFASGDFTGPLCFSNGVEWLGTRMGASRSSSFYTTNLSARTVCGKYQMLEDTGSTVTFMSAGVYDITYINGKWLFSDDACIINEGTVLSATGSDDENKLINGTIRVYGSGIIEQDFWTRNVLSSADTRMCVPLYLSLADAYYTIPKMQFGCNSDYASATNNVSFTFTENYSYDTDVSVDETITSAMNICLNGNTSGSQVGGTQLWNWRSGQTSGVQDWIRTARVDVE